MIRNRFIVVGHTRVSQKLSALFFQRHFILKINKRTKLYFNIVTLVFHTLRPAMQKLLNTFRKEGSWHGTKPLMHRVFDLV